MTRRSACSRAWWRTLRFQGPEASEIKRERTNRIIERGWASSSPGEDTTTPGPLSVLITALACRCPRCPRCHPRRQSTQASRRVSQSCRAVRFRGGARREPAVWADRQVRFGRIADPMTSRRVSLERNFGRTVSRMSRAGGGNRACCRAARTRGSIVPGPSRELIQGTPKIMAHTAPSVPELGLPCVPWICVTGLPDRPFLCRGRVPSTAHVV
ncbi:hypothetical protein B0H67DRAFT_345018 [Lasiosphaeris hirsuta]|uniref:Uncharacterized protein n=1 Tax=Lasiosphaeris hirsuta TaxID=260670 RepID=A0AA40DMG7_9PEZI|nr:hypothetical protein B0H67DRAFT_345018 [Lasiosphaeris hirsuta]